MLKTWIVAGLAALVVAAPTAATDLVLPAFALDMQGIEGNRWSSELYLVNPGELPVQVTLSGFLPGSLVRPAPCDLFMTPTRVVPPRSSVVWTSGGLATDLGCAERAVGALVLNADGPVRITSRLVNHESGGAGRVTNLLTGRGQEVEATPVDDLPGRGRHLLAPMLWHRNPCGERAFDAYLGLANPADTPRRVRIDVASAHSDTRVRVDDEIADLPLDVVVPARGWRQVHLEPVDLPVEVCLPPEGVSVVVDLDGPVAVYGSVVDRASQDPRTVTPVEVTTGEPASPAR